MGVTAQPYSKILTAKQRVLVTTPSGATATLDLSSYANHTLSMTSGSGLCTVTLTPPTTGSKAADGYIEVIAHATTVRDIDFVSTVPIEWKTTEPDWDSLPVNSKTVIGYYSNGSKIIASASDLATLAQLALKADLENPTQEIKASKFWLYDASSEDYVQLARVEDNEIWVDDTIQLPIAILGTSSIVPASTISGVLDPAIIPAIAFTNRVISSGDLTALTTPQQAEIVQGTVVTTTDGKRWQYVSGTKTLAASYIVLSDITPEWSEIANKPTTRAGYGITDVPLLFSQSQSIGVLECLLYDVTDDNYYPLASDAGVLTYNGVEILTGPTVFSSYVSANAPQAFNSVQKDQACSNAGALRTTGGVLAGAISFSGTGHVGAVLNSLTTTERNNLGSVSNGSVIYHSTTNRGELRASGAWRELIDSSGGQTINGALTLTGVLSFSGTGHAGLQVNSLTSTQITALGSIGNGFLPYDSTSHRLRVRANGAWRDVIDSVGGAMQFAEIAGTTALYSNQIRAMNGNILTLGSSAADSNDNIANLFLRSSARVTFGDVGVSRSVAGMLEVNSNTANQHRDLRLRKLEAYGTYTDESNYVRGALSANATSVTLAAETAGTGADNVDVNITPAGTGLTILSSGLRGPTNFDFHNGGTLTGVFRFRDASNNTRAQLDLASGSFSNIAGLAHLNSSRGFNFTGYSVDAIRGDLVAWRATSFGAFDTGIGAPSPGLVEFNNGTAGTYRDAIMRNITLATSGSLTLAANNQGTIEFTSNTAGNIVYRGSDGTTRRFAFTLS